MELSHWKTRFTSFQDEFAYVWLNKNKISRIEWGLALGLAFGMRRGFRMSKHAAKEMLKTLPKPPAAGTPERRFALNIYCEKMAGQMFKFGCLFSMFTATFAISETLLCVCRQKDDFYNTTISASIAGVLLGFQGTN